MAREHVERESERTRSDGTGGDAAAGAAGLRSAGNQAATAVLDTYEIGRADDVAELQADTLAANALAGIPGLATGGAGAAGVLRRHTDVPDRLGGSSVDADTAQQISGARGGGSPLPSAVRGDLERGFGTGLGGVRVHTDATADTLSRKVDAAAFTAGQDVFFRQGTYAPDTDVGRQVIAHEVAHTVQGGSTIRRLMSAKQFRASTYTGGHMRGAAIKAIDKHMADIEKLKAAYDKPPAAPKKAAVKGTGPSAPPPPDNGPKISNLEKRIQLIREMEYMAQGWITDHTVEQTLTDTTPTTAPTSSTTAPPPPSSAPPPPPPGPTPAPPPPGPAAKKKKTMEDPKRKQRMDGVKVFLKGGPYSHPNNVSGKDIVEPAPRALDHERSLLEDALTSLRGPATPGAPVPVSSAGESKSFKKIKQKYEGDAKSMFTSLAGLVNAAVPNEGDSVEVDLTAKIPVDPNAIGFVQFHLILSADHDSLVGEVTGSEGKDNIVIRGELLVGGGANVAALAEIKAELGMYAEASSNTAQGALTLMSYGVYRRWRESKAVPSGLVSYMWSSRTGEFGYEKSEAWANQVEQEQFSDTEVIDPATGQAQIDPVTGKKVKEKNDAYVETGIVGGVSGKVGQKFGDVGAKMEASAKFGGGRRYNKESIERVKGEGNLGARNQDKSGGDAVMGGGAQKSLADDTFFFEIGGEFEVTPLSGGMTLMGKFGRPASATFRKAAAQQKKAGGPGAAAITDDTWKAETIELSADLGFNIPGGGAGADMASKVIRPVATSLASLPGVVRTLVAKQKGDLANADDRKSRGAGTALDVAQASLPTLSQYVKQFGEPDNFTDISTDLAEASGPTLSGGLKIGVSIGFDFLEKELAIEFSTTQSIELEIPLFFEGSIEKSKRIVAFKFSGDGVKVS